MSSKGRVRLVFGAVVVFVTVIGAGTAAGIVYGEPDDGEHPYVGSMVALIPGEDPFQVCSGTVLPGAGDYAGQDIFLTASHCLGFAEVLPPGSTVVVTFDETITPSSTFITGSEHAHPNFPGSGSEPFDIGVIVLDDNAGVGYGALADAGLLDTLKADRVLDDQTFTAVGYGTVRDTRKKAFESILANLDRNKADQEALSLTKAWFTLSMNQATGDGGTCYGDSGGPHLLEGTNTIVSITITGDIPCKASDKTYRVDTAVARDFLDEFVAVP